MFNLKELEALTDSQWTGVRFSGSTAPESSRGYRLCEAITCSFKRSISLSLKNIVCPGALRSLGCLERDEALTRRISDESGVALAHVSRIISNTPFLEKGISSVELGRIESPHVYTGHVSPEGAMRLLRLWQSLHGDMLSLQLTSFMSVCSAVVAAFQNSRPVYSFGCPDSRRCAGIEAGMLVAVLPRSAAAHAVKDVSSCGRMKIPAVRTAATGNDCRV